MTKLVTVEFHDDTLFAAERPDGIFVAPKPICDALGIEWRKQHERMKRDPVLSEGITMTVMPSPGGPQETTILRLQLLPGWLFGIDEARVKPEARDRVLAYKRECFEVLFRHFYGAARAEGEAMAAPPLPHAAREEPVRVRRQLVTEARHVFGERAAGRLWFALGLPIVPEMHTPPAQSDFDFTYTAIPTPPRPPGSGPA
ncbi:UNVERIFIED_CONTAM: phage antirepressor N-terminal domain-containing protein [Methylobacteriaceae bacterium AG10]|nr:phage antirepressor N-terminal domain-containing protein [Methylobacteriaceae bacterium AG10]